MVTYITVGSTVVGAFEFHGSAAMARCLKMLAPGVRPHIKKCPPQCKPRRTQTRSNEARSVTNSVGDYRSYPRQLLPGEFKL